MDDTKKLRKEKKWEENTEAKMSYSYILLGLLTQRDTIST